MINPWIDLTDPTPPTDSRWQNLGTPKLLLKSPEAGLAVWRYKNDDLWAVTKEGGTVVSSGHGKCTEELERIQRYHGTEVREWERRDIGPRIRWTR